MQRLRRLLARRSAREAEKAFVVEGHTLVREALDSGNQVESVYIDPGAARSVDREIAAMVHDRGGRVYELGAGVLERVADTVTPQAIMGVVPTVSVGLDDLSSPLTLVLVCVDVRDPGNLGSLLRSAAAAGADGVVVCEGSVDVYSPKTVRASAGAVFHVPVMVGGPVEGVIEALRDVGLYLAGTVKRGGLAYTEVDLSRPTAIVLGNEASGLPEETATLLDFSLSIPMRSSTDSLNVGTAAAIISFEAARQRALCRTGSGT